MERTETDQHLTGKVTTLFNGKHFSIIQQVLISCRSIQLSQ